MYQRKTPRLSNYDYSADGYYFITICTNEHKCLFGLPEQKKQFGEIARQELDHLYEHYEFVKIEKAVVMPNHVHAIIVLGANHYAKENPNINNIVGAYKAAVSRKIHTISPKMKVWQRSYYDHVIRNEADYSNIWTYIDNNPAKWKEDKFFREQQK